MRVLLSVVTLVVFILQFSLLQPINSEQSDDTIEAEVPLDEPLLLLDHIVYLKGQKGKDPIRVDAPYTQHFQTFYTRLSVEENSFLLKYVKSNRNLALLFQEIKRVKAMLQNTKKLVRNSRKRLIANIHTLFAAMGDAERQVGALEMYVALLTSGLTDTKNSANTERPTPSLSQTDNVLKICGKRLGMVKAILKNARTKCSAQIDYKKAHLDAFHYHKKYVKLLEGFINVLLDSISQIKNQTNQTVQEQNLITQLSIYRGKLENLFLVLNNANVI